MLIDHYLPLFQFREQHEILADASPGALLDAAAQPQSSEDPWARRFIALRELPGRLAGVQGLQDTPPFGLGNFVPLGRDGDRELAFGLLGKFWQADYGLMPVADASAFSLQQTPGVAKLVLNFSTSEDASGRTRLHTETRVYCNNRHALLRFTPYWWLIRPVSGLIRKRLLARINQTAQQALSNPA
jgi:hypothetical protein